MTDKIMVRIAKQHHKTVSIPNLFHKMPSLEDIAPRDGVSNISRSADVLFLVCLISGKCGKFVHHFTKEDRSIYLKERDGIFYHPVSNEQFTVDAAYVLKNTIRSANVRGYVKDNFYSMRKRLRSLARYYDKKAEAVYDRDDPETFTVGRTVLEGEGATPNNFRKFEKKIKHTVLIEDDPFLEHLNEQVFLNFDSQKKCTARQAICPYDGVVTPIYATIRSPGWTWQRLVGREWGFALCPHCFGLFAQRMICMN